MTQTEILEMGFVLEVTEGKLRYYFNVEKPKGSTLYVHIDIKDAESFETKQQLLGHIYQVAYDLGYSQYSKWLNED